MGAVAMTILKKSSNSAKFIFASSYPNLIENGKWQCSTGEDRTTAATATVWFIK